MVYPKIHETVIDLVKDLDKDIKIVDLGCGTGDMVLKLKELEFKNIEYCDIKDSFNGKVKIMDFNDKIDFKDNSFDLAISTEVINCLYNSQRFFEEIKRILKPGGTLIITFPNLFNLPNKLTFLFKSRFIGSWETFFLWQIPSFFEIEELTYNRGFIPIIRIPFIKNKLFGQSTIIRYKVKE